jgi:hypothetical protein
MRTLVFMIYLFMFWEPTNRLTLLLVVTGLQGAEFPKRKL